MTSNFSPKWHLAGVPRLEWDASTGPHLTPDRVCGFEVTDWWHPKVLCVLSKEPRVFPCTRACKDPTLAPVSASSLCMRGARQHHKEECQALLYLCVFQEPCLEEHLAFICQAVWVQPTQTLCQFQGLPAVFPFLLSPPESLVFPEFINLQPHHRPLAPLQAWSPGLSLPLINVKCKERTLRVSTEHQFLWIYKKLWDIYLIYLSFSTWEGRGN